jgi:hypothetical protein
VRLQVSEPETNVKVIVSFGGMLLPPSDSDVAAQAAQALAQALLAMGGGATVSPISVLANDGTAQNAQVLDHAVHRFTEGSGAVILPAGETNVWHLVANFTGVPMPVLPQPGAAFERSTIGTPYMLSDTGVMRLIALSETEAMWL